MVAGVQRYDFSPDHKRENNSAYFHLFPSLSLFIFSPALSLFSSFLLATQYNASTLAYFPFRLRPFRPGFYELQSVPPQLIPLREKPDSRISFTADSVASGLHVPVHREPDLQGNYHALIHESTAHTHAKRDVPHNDVTSLVCERLPRHLDEK